MTFRIRHFKTLPSTSSYLLESPPQKIKEGLVISTAHQTKGRGKPGREWISPAGKNLLFSVLIKPPIAPSKAPLITQTACRSVAAVLKKHGIESHFKRPNDILVKGKKICGILVETGTRGSKLEYVIIGVGLNVNASPPELEGSAVSMKEAGGRIFALKPLLKEVLTRLGKDLEAFYAPDRV